MLSSIQAAPATAPLSGSPRGYGEERQGVKAEIARKIEEALPGDAVGDEPGRKVEPVVRELENVSLVFNRRLKFEIDHESREVIVKVIDAETDKVIKELPSEEIQRLRDRIRETLGLLFDEKV